jgi:hypothetical protein
VDSRQEINQVLAQMGEPPLGPGDKVQTQFVEESAMSVEAEDKTIQLLEPPGFKRCHIFFANGRQLDLDMQIEELVAAVRDFMAHPERDFLELPHIEAVGEQGTTPVVVVANPTYLPHRALELMQSMGISWMRRVPGQEVTAPGKVAVVRGNDAKSVIVSMNREQRRRLERNGG